MHTTCCNTEDVLQRLQQAFQNERTPQQYASALRKVIDDYTLMLIDSGEDRSYATANIYDLQHLISLLEC